MAKYIEKEQEILNHVQEIKKSEPKFNVYNSLDKIFLPILNSIFDGTIDKNTLEKGHRSFRKIKILLNRKFSEEEKKSIHNAFIFLHRNKYHNLIENESFLNAILNVCSLCLFWKRNLDGWNPKSYNSEKQISSLLRHLFCDFSPPKFLNSAWYQNFITTENSKMIDLFIDIGEGKSLKNHKSFPIEMTKKMIHHFINSPDNFKFNEAVRRAQILSLGGDENLVYAILGSRIGDNFRNDKFWSTVIDYFCKIPMLDNSTVSPIIDYINEEKFVSSLGERKDGTYGQCPPNQPNFSIKGRIFQNLLDATEGWHKELNKLKKAGYNSWAPSGIKPFEHKEGKEEKNNFKLYSFTEILNTKSLQEEGSKMGHCVFSYQRSCISGTCSIWSLKLFNERLLTIEVKKDGTIVQVRGKLNRRADAKEKEIIDRWTKYTNLKISNFAY